jgi:hypothetical protein
MARAGPSCAICSLSSPIASKLAWRAGQGARVLQCAFQHALLSAAAQRLRQLRQLSQPQMLHGSRSACVLQVFVVRVSEKCDNEDAQQRARRRRSAHDQQSCVSHLRTRGYAHDAEGAARAESASGIVCLFVCLFVCKLSTAPHRHAHRACSSKLKTPTEHCTVLTHHMHTETDMDSCMRHSLNFFYSLLRSAYA